MITVNDGRRRARRFILGLALWSAALCVAGTAIAEGGSTPAQISIWPTGAQLPTDDRTVNGLSFNLYYGKQLAVNGVELGLINGVIGDFKGLGLGMANSIGGDAHGLQVAASNTVEGDVKGLQIGFMASRTESELTGLQLGFGGNGAKRASGLQMSLYNWTEEHHNGAQLGVFGRAQKLQGMQLNAFASWAESCRGLQIGLIVNRSKSGACTQIGFLNLNDKGFLKAFPVVNFSVR